LLAAAAEAPRAQTASCAATATSMTPAAWAPPAGHSPPGRPAGAAGLGASPLTLVADVPLPGAARRFDYQSVDTAAGRLYVSHMRGDRLVVYDLRRDRLVASLEGFPGATGVWAVPELHRVFVAVSGHHEVVAVDDSTLRVVARVPDVRFPDGIAHVPELGKVYVSDESGEADVVIDARRGVRVATIPLGGEAGNTHYDAVSRCIVVAVQTRNELAAIDPASDRVVARYRVGCDHPHGFLIDEPNRMAFVSCEGDAKLLAIDLRTMRTTGTYRVGDDPDVLALDPGLHRLYVACESGVVSVFDERGQTLTAAGEYRASHAHSVAVDPATHRVFLPLQDVGGRPVLRIMAPGPGAAAR